MVMTLAVALLTVSLVQATPPVDSVNDLISFGAAFASSALLGIIKRNTTVFDRDIGNFIRPAQPFIVAGLTVALPFIGKAINVVDLPSADIWANAPTATLVAITAREALRRLRGEEK